LHFYLEDRGIKFIRNIRKHVPAEVPACCWFCLLSETEEGNLYIPSKSPLHSTRLLGVTSQKIVLFIDTTVRTSNLSLYIVLRFQNYRETFPQHSSRKLWWTWSVNAAVLNYFSLIHDDQCGQHVARGRWYATRWRDKWN
jgi:hypothetical protein